MTDFDWLDEIVKARTPGEWSYDDGSFMVSAPDNAEGTDSWGWQSSPAQYWQGFEEDEKNKYDADKDEIFFATMGTLADKIMDVVKAAEDTLEDELYTGERPSRSRPSEARLFDALTALRAAQKDLQ